MPIRVKIRSMDTNLVSKVLNQDVFENSGLEEKILKKKIEKTIGFFIFIFNCVKSLPSGKNNVLFPDSPDFENFPDFRTGRNVRQSTTIHSIALTSSMYLQLIQQCIYVGITSFNYRNTASKSLFANSGTMEGSALKINFLAWKVRQNLSRLYHIAQCQLFSKTVRF